MEKHDNVSGFSATSSSPLRRMTQLKDTCWIGGLEAAATLNCGDRATGQSGTLQDGEATRSLHL